jgi:hypothetical protein
MIDASENAPRPGAQSNPGVKVRDVADFHLRWREFRPVAKALGQSARLTEVESDTLHWMVELLDRIGPKDLEEGQS